MSNRDEASDATSTASTTSWRRSTLSFREKFIDAHETHGVRVRQYASRSAFEKAIGSARVTTRGDVIDDDDGASDATTRRDPVPETGFTVWDASALLGKYVGREDVWRRLIANDDDASTAMMTTTLELGAGTGLCTLLVATSEAVRGMVGLKKSVACAMTDLPGVVEFTRENARDNKAENGGNVPKNVALAVAALTWGDASDVEKLPEAIRFPNVVLGADLMYTMNVDVIRALAETTRMLVLPGRVAVFAACKEHRPESIEVFVEFMREFGFDVVRVPASTAHPDLPASDDEFEILECWKRQK
jgi:hypothetical protein